MDTKSFELIIKTLLNDIHTKLADLAQMARAACACADAGSVKESIRLSMDLDQHLYDLGRLHDAVILLGQRIEE